jgi:hypothetical protein
LSTRVAQGVEHPVSSIVSQSLRNISTTALYERRQIQILKEAGGCQNSFEFCWKKSFQHSSTILSYYY